MTTTEINAIAMKTAEILKTSIMNDPKMLDYIFPAEFLDVDEAARYMRIKKATLYGKIDEIPHRKQGKRLVFSKRELAKYVMTC